MRLTPIGLLALVLPIAPQRSFYEHPDWSALAAEGPEGIGPVIRRYTTDLRTHQRFFDAPLSEERRARLRDYHDGWLRGLGAFHESRSDAIGLDEAIDLSLLDNLLRYELQRLEIEEVEAQRTAMFLAFAPGIVALHESRRRLESIAGEAAAEELESLRAAIETQRADVEELASVDRGEDEARTFRLLAHRAAGDVRRLKSTLASWFGYYDGYDPLFSWWAKEPYGRVEDALDAYATFLTKDVVGIEEGDDETILGDPIGREALGAELLRERIPYSPEELVEIAHKEFAWCEREMLAASFELGFGEDWKAALEHVKGLHVAPGEQTELIAELADEAVRFLEEHELLTIPALAKASWRMEMMSPARQKFSPYFTGGEVISVSFPTADMSHADKRMSMRGNNIHFSRAVVHHELIPGHHLQQFMNARHRTYRRPFRTPFWGEGWALYWEMLLWDQGFARSPEDRVGMLFWRMHRCARILFSLGFHLGDMTPQECIDFLVERVGHERANASAEVRRSVQGGYGPLYQCAYMIGGLQFRALYMELVASGRMTARDFHDAILREGSIPVELLRAKLVGKKPTPGSAPSWRFYDALEQGR